MEPAHKRNKIEAEEVEDEEVEEEEGEEEDEDEEGDGGPKRKLEEEFFGLLLDREVDFFMGRQAVNFVCNLDYRSGDPMKMGAHSFAKYWELMDLWRELLWVFNGGEGKGISNFVWLTRGGETFKAAFEYKEEKFRVDKVHRARGGFEYNLCLACED